VCLLVPAYQTAGQKPLNGCVCVFCVSFNNFGFALLVSFVGFGFSSTEPRDRLGRMSPK